MKNKLKLSKEEEYKIALINISLMGANLKPEIIDWQNIGKRAVHLASDVLQTKCPTCGAKRKGHK